MNIGCCSIGRCVQLVLSNPVINMKIKTAFLLALTFLFVVVPTYAQNDSVSASLLYSGKYISDIATFLNRGQGFFGY